MNWQYEYFVDSLCLAKEGSLWLIQIYYIARV